MSGLTFLCARQYRVVSTPGDCISVEELTVWGVGVVLASENSVHRCLGTAVYVWTHLFAHQYRAVSTPGDCISVDQLTTWAVGFQV
jgi:hypothetical protein